MLLGHNIKSVAALMLVPILLCGCMPTRPEPGTEAVREAGPGKPDAASFGRMAPVGKQQ